MSTLLVKNAILNKKSVNVFCKDGIIKQINDDTPDADTILEAQGKTIHLPMINSHTHSSMTLFRGNGDDLPLMKWLTERVWPYETGIREEEVYWGAKLAILEMIKTGTVFFNDMYWKIHNVARAVEEMGIRAMLARVWIDNGENGTIEHNKRRLNTILDEAKKYSDRIQFSLGPHAIYTVSESGLRWIAEFADEKKLNVHIHLSETEQEVKDCYNTHGCSPVDYLEKVGLLNDRLIAAHTVWLSENDISKLGEHNVLCVHNPVSNMKLTVNGHYPYKKLKDAGAVTALATDGAGSNNNLDMFEEMKIAALLQKFCENKATELPASENLAMATTNALNKFNLGTGVIKEGCRADFILLDLDLPEMNPIFDLASHLVYAANGNVVDSVVCDGKVLMKNRYIEGSEEIIENAREAAHNLFSRVDEAN